MGIADAFGREDRVEVKFSDFYKLVKQAAQLETVMNGVNCDVPHKYIREMQTGKKEKGPDAEKYMVTGMVRIGIDLAQGETGEPEPDHKQEETGDQEEAQEE